MMIVGLKDGHDGAAAIIADGELLLSYEAEKDSGIRYSALSGPCVWEALNECKVTPDLVAVSGFVKRLTPPILMSRGGYEGLDRSPMEEGSFFGRPCRYLYTSHERAHIACARGLAPFPDGQSCYALIWEGGLGSFYRVDGKGSIVRLVTPLSFPGVRYNLAYSIGAGRDLVNDGSVAGKLMALAAFADRDSADAETVALTDRILGMSDFRVTLRDYQDSPYYGVGVTNRQFMNFAGVFSDRLYEHFFHHIKPFVTEKLPLLIAGGCGLNCDWNARWHQSGLFDDVFIPPCANDSGVALGTAIDAWQQVTGKQTIRWNVYSGQRFHMDQNSSNAFKETEYDPTALAGRILSGAVIAWVQGRCEIGPRALGHRSLLAYAGSPSMRERLNKIKQREWYRPIAPLVLEEDAPTYFVGKLPSPHMLFFHRVQTDGLPAITHVDGSARVQTVGRATVPRLTQLLDAVRTAGALPVLCNTSLNFPGFGFINRFSELAQYANERGLDGFVVENRMWFRN